MTVKRKLGQAISLVLLGWFLFAAPSLGYASGMGRVAGELTMGALVGVLGGLAGASIGLEIISKPECDDCLGWGGILGFLSGTALGSSAGVYGTGRQSHPTRVYWGALLGGALGTSAMAAFALGTKGDENDSRLLVTWLLLPSIGATLGFEATGDQEQAALIHLERGQPKFAMPGLQVGSTGDLTARMDLVRLSF